MRGRHAVALAIAAGAAISVRYRSDAKRAAVRLRQFDVRRVNTLHGTVEYCVRGDGPPMLVIHGIVGGWDGALCWRTFEPPGVRAITPARFGYLGSAMPEAASVDMQAEVFEMLLDALGIQDVPVLAFSAGSTCAVQLALRQPSRVSRLALVCANSPHPEPLRLPPRASAPYLFSQPVFWALRTFAPWLLRRIAGFPPSFAWDAEARCDEAAIVESFFPITRRTPGIVFDAYDSNPAIAKLRLEDVRVPAIVVHAVDDPIASFDDARAMARRFPRGRFFPVFSGGHVFLHRDAAAVAAVREFLRGYVAD